MRVATVVLIVCQLTAACTGWRLEPLSPAAVIQQQQPSAIRVDRADGRREVWYNPELRGDTLIGWRGINGKEPDRAVPLADIKQVATSHVSAAKTIPLLMGFAAVAAALIAVSTIQGPFDNWGRDP